MILPNEKLIYIHVPKTGGASVEDFLLDKFGYKRSPFTLTDGIGYQRVNSKNNGNDTAYPYLHYTLPQIIEIASKNNIQIDNTWNIFSIVRNPYYKLISELFFLPITPLPFHYHTIPLDIRGRLVNECIDQYFNNNNISNYHSNHSLPQYQFFEGVKLNYQILKFENGLENIMNKLGFEVKNDFPHRLNMFHHYGVPKPNYKDVLTPYLVEFVNERYQKDFETFKYNMLSPLDI